MADQEDNKPSYAELEALYAQQLKRNEDLEGELATSTELVSDLNTRLDNATVSAELSQVIVVTHEQKKYRVIGAKFKHKGTEYAAADLSKHADVVAALVESGSELLQLVPAKAKANASK